MSSKEAAAIGALVESGIGKLSQQLQDWTRTHLVAPYPVDLLLNPDKPQTAQFWIVTDHVGTDDSSYRIVYNPISKTFGLEGVLEDKRHWYMGDCGTLDETVENM